MLEPERKEPEEFFWLDLENLPDRESFIRYGPPRDLWHTVTAMKARGKKLPAELSRRVVEALRAPPGYVYPDPKARIPLMTDHKWHLTKKSPTEEATTSHPETHRQLRKREASPVDSSGGIGLKSNAVTKECKAANFTPANPM
ncbi:hypothetical protein RUND412_005708 [Rhizina undulata]